MFYLATSVIGLAASAITVKTLIGYTAIRWWYKLIVAGIILFGWFGHVMAGYCRHHHLLNLPYYQILAAAAYIGLGFVFVLLMLILVRDTVWFAAYGMAKLFKPVYAETLNPYNLFALNAANIAVVILTILLTAWGMYEGLKFPHVKTVTIADAKIKTPFKLVQLSDLHINRVTSVAKVEKLTAAVNALKPDVVVITGDLVDEPPSVIENQMQALSRLQASHGVYSVIGNHDIYSGLLPWLKKFAELNLNPLFNSGQNIDDKIYIAGLPDKSIEGILPRFKLNLKQALQGNTSGLYTVLLSHTPDFGKNNLEGVDLQLSGHTHGGQIFPFHLLIKPVNKYLAGLYQEEGYKVYVSRGAGFWGPPIRLLAPSEITVFELVPEK